MKIIIVLVIVCSIATICFLILNNRALPTFKVSIGDQYFSVIDKLGKKQAQPTWDDMWVITTPTHVIIPDQGGDIDIPSTKFVGMSFSGGQLTGLEVCLVADYVGQKELKQIYESEQLEFQKRGWVKEKQQAGYTLDGWLANDPNISGNNKHKYAENWIRANQSAQIVVKRKDIKFNQAFLINLSFDDEDLSKRVNVIRKKMGFTDKDAFSPVPNPENTFSQVMGALYEAPERGRK